MLFLTALAPRFGGGSETHVHPGVLVAVLLASALILLVPRRFVIVPLVAATLLIPTGQVIQLGPLHWTMLRILVLVGWIRLLATSVAPPLAGGLNALDKALILWAGISAFNILLLWRSPAALVNQFGALYNVFGVYFLMRFLIRNGEDSVRAIRAITCVGVVVAAIMLLEQTSGQNLYAGLRGGEPQAAGVLWDRAGTVRALAGFGNAVSAGVFGATLMPLALALWWKRHKATAIAGVCASTLIVAASVSSTPTLAYLAAALALGVWGLRRHLRLLRWSLVIFILVLHFVMKAPVWALIQRLGVIDGSSGYHRYILVDRFLRHFWDWWLVGARDVSGWGPLSHDIANQYVGIGETAGLVPLVFFIAIIVYGFKFLGSARYAASDGGVRRFLWAIGCALLAHVVAFFGLSYFDQMTVAWYLLLAIVSAVAAPLAASAQVVRPAAAIALPASPLQESC